MAIHHTLKLSIREYQDEPAHIFTDSLNSLYLLITQIKHPSLHTNYPDKTILSKMVDMLQQRTQITSLLKVRAHSKIHGNEIANELAKAGRRYVHTLSIFPHEHAHSTPYFLPKKIWKERMARYPYKGPIRHLQRYIIKYTHEYHLQQTTTNLPNIKKWTEDSNIDNQLSNNFWKNPKICEAQIKQLLKFRIGQYMGNAQKNLFWPTRFPNPTCSLCNLNSIDTWLHVILCCIQQHIHAFHVQRHNKAVWEIKKLLLSHPSTRYFTLMNAGTFNNNPLENTVPLWLLACSCNTQRCYCNEKFKPNILHIIGLTYQSQPPNAPHPNKKIQFIEFTYTNDQFSQEKIQQKIDKYTTLIEEIRSKGWRVCPLIVITAGAKGSTHIPSLDILTH